MIKIILIIMAVFILYCMIETARELRNFHVTEYQGLCEGVSEKQMHKKDNILKRSA